MQRRRLAGEAFAHTAAYDAAVAAWFAETGRSFSTELGGERPGADSSPVFAGSLAVEAQLATQLRYGENAHQAAALYTVPRGAGIAQATRLGGKQMSYNNYVDADAAVRAAYDHESPAVAIVKHANPCGIATAPTIAEAHALAHACDPVSAFGGVIAANRPITREAAESIAPVFTEVVVAPGFEPGALELLQAKKNLRILQLPPGYAAERSARGEPRCARSPAACSRRSPTSTSHRRRAGPSPRASPPTPRDSPTSSSPGVRCAR